MASEITKGNGDGEELDINDAMAIIVKAHGRKLEGQELASIRELLAKDKDVWKATGDLGQQIRSRAVSYLGESNTLAQESVAAGVDKMRKNLAEKDANQLERLAIEQILTCWVHCDVVGMKLQSNTQGKHSMSEGMYWEKRYHLAQARLSRSMELLGKLRRLRIPNVQVNIGENQINVN